MQCVFVGPPRSGKSTLMKRMVGERPSSSSSFSTGVANKVVQVIVRSSSAAASVSGSKWVKLSHDDEAVMIVMDTSHLNEVAGSERHSQATETVPQPERCNTTLDTSVSKQNKHQAKLSESSAASSDVADPKLAVDFCKGALQRNLQYAKKILQDKGWLIYLTDTGGQIEFQELLPLLVLWSIGVLFSVSIGPRPQRAIHSGVRPPKWRNFKALSVHLHSTGGPPSVPCQHCLHDTIHQQGG